jgi:hypothetical protein
MNFPGFDGSNPKLWKHRCEIYFDYYFVPVQRWVRMVVMHFEGSAQYWVQAMESRVREMNWESLCAALNTRFGRDQHNTLIRQFYHIRQTNSVVDYVEQFDQLMHQLLAHENQLTSAMITTRFIDGLRDDVKSAIIIQRPPDLDTACALAILQEEVLMHMGRRDMRRTDFSNFTQSSVKSAPMSLPLPPAISHKVAGNTEDRRGNVHGTSKSDEGKLTALRAYRRAKGLCFRCGERWGHTHRCSTSVPLHLVEEMWELAIEGEEVVEETEGNTVEPAGENVLAISLDAVSGGEGNKTIRLWASIHCQQVLVLVDSGSSASFLGSHLLGVMPGIQLLTRPVQVKVADGRTLWSRYEVPDCSWLCEGLTFSSNFKILPLGGYDMILGMDWLECHSPMAVHWAQKWLEFEYDQRKVRLQGVLPNTQTCNNITCLQLNSLIRQEGVEQLLELQQMEQTAATEIPEPIKQLLSHYPHLFSKPHGLPPKRTVDHAIDLIPGAPPFRLRPYRYTPQQKDEIEKQIQEMLDSGIVQQSSSPFASPVLLVKKKDGEWRLCVDYRKLNSYTVKNRYPMPIFDEIVDELAGASVFSKLDHRSGYHQIRLREGDEPKTAFQTHHGHFEYRVMPFGLTGAPATFQDFMNQLLAPFLRKWVVVFLDDVLVYSATMEEHVGHLKQVLDLISQQQLYLRESKCVFGQAKLEFLGHIVSAAGITTDPNKIRVIREWPKPACVKDVRSFLGMAGYYRKFVPNFGIISRSLTNL